MTAISDSELKKAILKGKIFIYPTDTIYGLGCNAENQESVKKIKKIKTRDSEKPLSIIAPSISWIKEHCIFDEILEKYLPGPYTLILEKLRPGFLSHVSPTSTLGIRIPKNEFCDRIRNIGKPFVTTSVNLSREPFATSIDSISKEIKDKVDIIQEAKEKLSGKPSTLIINGKILER